MADELERARVAQARGSMAGLKVIGEDLLGEATRRAPIEEGTLRGSGMLTFIVNGTRYEGTNAYATATAAAVAAARAGTLRTLDVEVAFASIYAAAQHEGLDFEHPLGGEALYLQRPLMERQARYPAILALEQRRHMG